MLVTQFNLARQSFGCVICERTNEAETWIFNSPM